MVERLGDLLAVVLAAGAGGRRGQPLAEAADESEATGLSGTGLVLAQLRQPQLGLGSRRRQQHVARQHRRFGSEQGHVVDRRALQFVDELPHQDAQLRRRRRRRTLGRAARRVRHRSLGAGDHFFQVPL